MVVLRAHVATVDVIHCSVHGQAEFVSAAHRKMREGVSSRQDLDAYLKQMDRDTAVGALRWASIDQNLIDLVRVVFQKAPAKTFLRAADGLHLASAAANGFSAIYSNDKHLLAAAPLFGLKGINVIP